MTSRSSLRALALLAAAGLALAACSKGGGEGASTSGPFNADEMTLGDPKAPVKMVEYASVTCPHCAKFNLTVFPQIRRRYIDSGKVHYTFKEILTDPQEVAAAGFLTARCAGTDKYFTVVDSIFKSQNEMFSGGSPLEVLRKVATGAGLSGKQFDACVHNEKALAALYDRVEKNSREGDVGGTPSFTLNGQKIKEGEMSAVEFDTFYATAAGLTPAPAAAPAAAPAKATPVAKPAPK